MNRRQFIRSMSLGAGLVLLPTRSRAVVLEIIIGGVVICGGFYMGWKLSKWAKEKLTPVPPVPAPVAPPPMCFPTNAPASLAGSALAGTGRVDVDCSAMECLHDVSEANLVSPVDGGAVIGYGAVTFQRSTNGGAAWSDHRLEVWFNPRWLVLRFGAQIEQARFMYQITNLALRVPPAGEAELWRAVV